MDAADIPSDLTIVVEDRRFPVHRFLLMAKSKYWRALLSTKYKEGSQDVITLQDIDPDVFAEFINLIYDKPYTSSPALMFLVHMYNMHTVSLDKLHKEFAVPLEQFEEYITAMIELFGTPVSQRVVDTIASKMTSAEYRDRIPESVRERVFWSKNLLYTGDKWDPILRQYLEVVAQDKRFNRPKKLFRIYGRVMMATPDFITTARSREHAIIKYLGKYNTLFYKKLEEIYEREQSSLDSFPSVPGFKYMMNNGHILIVKDAPITKIGGSTLNIRGSIYNFTGDLTNIGSLLQYVTEYKGEDINIPRFEVINTDIFMDDISTQTPLVYTEQGITGYVLGPRRYFFISTVEYGNISTGRIDRSRQLSALTESEKSYLELFRGIRVIGPRSPITSHDQLSSPDWTIMKTHPGYVIQDALSGINLPCPHDLSSYLQTHGI
jgi:hypothetical protein